MKMEGALIILLIAKSCIAITTSTSATDSPNDRSTTQIQCPFCFCNLNYKYPGFNYFSLPEIQPHDFKPTPVSMEPAALSAPKDPVYTNDFTNQYYIRDQSGQAIYGHSEPGQIHHAVQDALGNKAGGFSYYDAEGKLVITNYIADAAGYRVSSNNLPIAPVFKPDLPIPPQDTPEVAEAKAKHLAELAKAQTRNKRDDPLTFSHTTSTPFIPGIPSNSFSTNLVSVPQNLQLPGIVSDSNSNDNNTPKVTIDGFLEDYPEVNDAKADHFAKVAKAKSHFPLTFHCITSTSSIIPGPPSNSFPTYPSVVQRNLHFPMSISQNNPTNYNTPRITVDGFLEDTPEITAAKADHFAKVASATANDGSYSSSLG